MNLNLKEPTRYLSVVAFSALLAVLPAKVSAETVVALTSNNTLLTFDSSSPASITDTTNISGLQGGENLVGLDYRPATSELYAVGDTSRLYKVNLNTGIATQVGSSGSFTLSGTNFGVDFNPVPDRLRVTSDNDQNLRLSPIDGTLTATDGTLAYAVGDVNQAANPNIVASAYTNNFAGATSTVLYGIDSDLDILVIQNPPNSGTLNTVGSLGVNASSVSGFDILTDITGGVTTEKAFATLEVSGVNQLYSINLATGQATLVNTVGSGTTSIVDMSIAGCVAPNITISNVTAPEGASSVSSAVFTAMLSHSCAGTVKVDYGTVNGTAKQGEDYLAVGGTLKFQPTQTSKTITVGILGDTVAETDETFSVVLFNALKGNITDNEGTGTIQNDDATPTTPTADLNIKKTVSSSKVMPGRDLTYRLTVTNTGDAAAVSTFVKDTLSSRVLFRSVTTSQGRCLAPAKGKRGTVICNLNNLPVGATATIKIVVKSNGRVRQQITNTATVRSQTAESNSSNNISTVNTTIVSASRR